MNRYGMRIAACAIAGVVAVCGYQTTTKAKLNRTSEVPAAGVAVVLECRSTIEEFQAEVADNRVYLENISSKRTDVVIPSAKVALAENNEDDETDTNSTVEPSEDEDNGTTAASESETRHPSTSAGFSSTGRGDEASEEKDTETEENKTASEEDTDAETDTAETDTAEEAEEAIETEEDTETEKDAETKEDTEETETEPEQDFSGLVIAQVSNYVNVRSIPSEQGDIVGKLYDKSVGEFIEEEDGWYKIKSGNCTGYVKGEYCVVGKEAERLAKEVGTTYAIVNTTTLKVRKEASTDSSVLGLVPMSEELVVVEELDGWVKIAIEEGDGYVSREYVNLRTDFVHAESKEEEEARLAKEAKAREEARAAAAAAEASRAAAKAEKSANDQAAAQAAQNTAAVSAGSDIGKAVINYATQFVGNPYVYGGSSLTSGTDCSGFVMSVYANFGVNLPHSSSALRNQGYDVGGIGNAQPGDIVCYSGHVGLYVGNGQIVHASNSRTGIIVSNAAYRNILTVRRIF